MRQGHIINKYINFTLGTTSEGKTKSQKVFGHSKQGSSESLLLRKHFFGLVALSSVILNKLENWNNKLEHVVSNLPLLSVDCPLEIEELNQVAQIHDPEKEDAVDYNLFITCKKFINKVGRKYPLSSQILSNPSIRAQGLKSVKCHVGIRKKMASCLSV